MLKFGSISSLLKALGQYGDNSTVEDGLGGQKKFPDGFVLNNICSPISRTEWSGWSEFPL